MLEYLQKSTGVFNSGGMLTKEQVKEMRKRAQTGEKNLWHGFISFNKENSEKIDDSKKCIALIKQTFGQFFKDAGFNPDNMDLMCALHFDRPEHLHIHYVFWEKEPKVKNQRAAEYKYRAKGKIPLDVIDKMTERLNPYTIEDDLVKKRNNVMDVFCKSENYSKAKINDIIRKWLKELADELPKDKPSWYGSKELAEHRPMIDLVAEWLIDLDDKTRETDHAFRQELREKEKKLKGIMGNYYKARSERELHIVQNMEGFTEMGGGLKTLYTIETLEWDYKRRLGNIVLKKVREIQRETYKRNPRRKYKTNDKDLKRRLAISTRKVRGIIDGLSGSVVELFSPETTNYRNRLKEMEEEMQAEYDKGNRPQETEQPKTSSKWNWGK